MPRIHSYSRPVDARMLDAFCALQGDFTDQFVYFDKGDGNASSPARAMGLGRCIALSSLHEVEVEYESPQRIAPRFFSFNRFDAENPKPVDSLFAAFPRLTFLLPEVVLVEVDGKVFLQVNSLGPVYEGRIERFLARVRDAAPVQRRTIPFSLTPDSFDDWNRCMEAGLDAITSGRVCKVVLSRRLRLDAQREFTSVDLLANLMEGDAEGTVFLYRYGDVFFCGCTPELLVRKDGSSVRTTCLAGTCPSSHDDAENAQLGEALLADTKNRAEHALVVDFIREAVCRTCYNVQVPSEPVLKRLAHVQHLETPITAQLLEGRTIQSVVAQLHPTPALAGSPVGEACMLIRSLEPYNRGFFGGPVGVVDADGNGEFSVGIRSGVFDGHMGWVYAGCGIVAGSEARDEYDEIDLKLKTILSAFGEE